MFLDLYAPAPFSHFDFFSKPSLAPEAIDNDKLTLDVPGYKQENIEIETSGSYLTIHGKSETRGNFMKRYRLRGVDAEAIEASLDAGVLTVSLPQAESAKPKKIAIQVAGQLPAHEAIAAE